MSLVLTTCIFGFSIVDLQVQHIPNSTIIIKNNFMLAGVLYCLVQPTFMYCLCFLALVCYFSVNMQPETSRSNEEKV